MRWGIWGLERRVGSVIEGLVGELTRGALPGLASTLVWDAIGGGANLRAFEGAARTSRGCVPSVLRRSWTSTHPSTTS